MSKDRPAGMDDLKSLHSNWPKPTEKTKRSTADRTSMAKVRQVASGKVEKMGQGAKVKGAPKGDRGGGAA